MDPTETSEIAPLVGEVLRLPRPVLFALDVDGTLAPIVEEPDAARVPPKIRALLRRLVKVPRIMVALVTGRAAGSLRKVCPVDGVWRAVEHGRVIAPPGKPIPREGLDPASLERLASFEAWAQEQVVPHGARLERKPSSRVVHVRRLQEEDEPEAKRLLRAAEKRAHALGLTPRVGRAVIEAEVMPGDKGNALEAIAFATRARGVVYAGDDVTDEVAIRRATQMGGVGLFVQSAERPQAPRGAAGVVAGPEGMGQLLGAIVEALEKRR